MNHWFLCKVQYEKLLDSGTQKKVCESYLVDAMSFTEAEAKIIEEITPFVRGSFIVDDIARYNISEFFRNENGEKFFKIKTSFITLDEKTGMEKKTPQTMLVQATDLGEAKKIFEDNMKNTMSDYELDGIVDAKILDVFYRQSA